MYESFLLLTSFKLRKAKPLKKNSSNREFTKDIYRATNTKLLLLTPMLFSKDVVIIDISKKGPNIKYAPRIIPYTHIPRIKALEILFLFALNKFLNDIDLSLRQNSKGKAKNKLSLINDLIIYGGEIIAST